MMPLPMAAIVIDMTMLAIDTGEAATAGVPVMIILEGRRMLQRYAWTISVEACPLPGHDHGPVAAGPLGDCGKISVRP